MKKKTPNTIIAIFKNKLGDGPEDLSLLLMKSFINSLPDIAIKPTTIIFMNSGIFLALKDSPVLTSLHKLQDAGVKILSCGTCLDYFKKKEELSAGRISNMHEIIERLTSADNIIFP
jgi:selenium metabolism protein YedF